SLSGGAAGAGAQANSTVTPTVIALVGEDSRLQAAGTIEIAAVANSAVDAETFGLGLASGVAIGISVATIEVGGTVSANMNGAVAGENDGEAGAANLSLQAITTATAQAKATAIAGGLLAAGSGAVATSTITP